MHRSSISKDSSFISAAWEQQRDLIEHVAQFSQHIIVLTAPDGGGKTHFLQYCARSAGNRMRKFYVSAKLTKGQSIIHKVAKQLGLLGSDIHLNSQQLRQALDAMLSASQTWVLYLDDADTLPITELKSLLQFAYSEKPQLQLHLVLGGASQLNKRLQSSDFKQLVRDQLHLIELGAWTLADFKAAAKQFGTHVKLTVKEIEAYYKLSKGWPGPFFQAIAMRVSGQADITLESRSQKEHQAMRRPSKKTLSNPVFLGMFMGVSIALAYLVPHLYDDDDDTPVNAMMVSNLAQESWGSPSDKMLSSGQYFEAQEPAAEEDLSPVIKQKPPLAKGVPIAKESTTENIKRFGYTSDEEKLLLSNSRFYTLELFQHNDAKRALDFVARHKLQDRASLFRTDAGEKNHYVVVYGQYASASKALTALDGMPATIQQDKIQPTVRELKGVQDEIRSRKEG